MNDLYIMHYGVGHDKGGHSGRYPWGSGDKIKNALKTVKERGINDIVAEKVAKKVQRETGQSDEEYLYNKERIKAIIKNVETYTVSTLVGMTLGAAGTVALRGYYTYKDIQKANKNVDNFIDNHSDIQVEGIQFENIQTENIYKEGH